MPVRSSSLAIPFIVVPVLAAAPVDGARAAERQRVDIPAVPLDRAIVMLAQQTGSDIGTAEPGLARVPTRGVRGRLSPAAALERLLEGTPFTAQRLQAQGFRIVRRSAPPPRPVAKAVAPRRPESKLAEPAPSAEISSAEPDIVVTAAKRATSRLRFPGAVTVLRPGFGPGIAASAAGNLDQAIAATPILQGTALGEGRNKLFIRGIADSSFTGPTQSTANVYLGDVPVAYNGPDPGLSLYDMDRVEVLEGPQGTLYGSGAIGGIVRLVPNPVDLRAVAGNVSGGIGSTRSGRSSSDLAAMVNIPLAPDALGVRAVAYRLGAGGYIDDVRRGLKQVNDATTLGGRLELRAAPVPGLTVDAGIIAQSVSARDLQYAERGLPPLSRAAALAQPFKQDYLLGRFVVSKEWQDGLRLVSATGIVRRESQSRFDATRPGRPDVPIAYDTDEHSHLWSHETRLSRTRRDGTGWLVGVALIQATDRFERKYGQIDRLFEIVGVSNRTLDLALFGEAGVAVSDRLTVTLGSRLTHQRSDGEPTGRARNSNFIRGRSVTRLDPVLGASWLLMPGVAVYARAQSGFRTGGITVAPGIGRVADLRPDTIRVAEVGIRRERSGPTGLAGSAGLSIADWRNVQADLVDSRGFPFTTNLGNSRIRGAEAQLEWIPKIGLRVDLATFLNDTRVVDGQPATLRNPGRRLPNTPPFALAANLGYAWSVSPRLGMSVQAGWRYFGRSSVGTEAPLDVSQGDYGSAHLGVTLSRRRFRVTATAENLFDVRGDRFAGGNPFALAARNEYTPLQPRTLRIGGSVDW